VYPQGWIQVVLKCLPTTWLSRCCAHLGCQTWGGKHDLQIKGLVVLMNALYVVHTQIPPWTSGLGPIILMMIGCAL